MTARGRLSVVAGGAIGFALLLGVWWLAAAALGSSRLPTPGAVASIFFQILTSSPSLVAQGGPDGILSSLLYTTQRVLLGVAIGSAVGVSVGITMGLSRIANEFLSSVIEVVRTIPPLAAVPFFLIWFGTGPTGQLLTVAFYTTVMVVVSARAAVQHMAPIHEAYATTLGAGWWQRVRTVVIPSIVPELLGGIRVALAFAWGVEVVAELLGSQRGIGFDFVLLSSLLQVDAMIAAILWIAIFAALADQLYVLLTKHFTRWMPRGA